jgi:hypothetical protein
MILRLVRRNEKFRKIIINGRFKLIITNEMKRRLEIEIIPPVLSATRRIIAKSKERGA